MISRLFNEHPSDVGMTYTRHFRFAMNLAWHTFRSSLASVVHAFLPFLFTTTTSRTIGRLYEMLKFRLKNEVPGKAEPISQPGRQGKFN